MIVTYKFTRYTNERIISETENIQSKSFLKAFVWMLNSGFNNSYSSSAIPDITNTLASIVHHYPHALSSFHPGGDTGYHVYQFGIISDYALADTLGIVLGTGSTALTVDDYKLATQIAHGVSTSQLEHFGSCCTNFTVDTGAGTAVFTLERVFLNSSGGSISVAEAGIYSAGNTSLNKFCILRDLVSPTQNVDDGEYLKVTYTFTITV